MEQLIQMKDQLISVVIEQMNNLKEVNTKELGEAIDMIKDLSEAVYYCSVTKAMEEEAERRNKAAEEQSMNTNNYYYTEKYIPYTMYNRDMDRDQGRMYYPNNDGHMSYYGGEGGNNSSSSNMSSSSGQNYYTERDYPTMRDSREGRSPMRRRMYMEAKSAHQDDKAMNDLENYMRDLNQDIMEMISQASPEEKQMLQKKINVLATKLQNV